MLIQTTQEFQYSPYSLLLDLIIAFLQEQAAHIQDAVVNRVIISSKFREEHARKVGDMFVTVLEAFSRCAELAFDLDLTSKDEEC
jgi:hypothetical protein